VCGHGFDLAIAPWPPPARNIKENAELGRKGMRYRQSIGALVLAISLCASFGARAFDDDKYLSLEGQWLRTDVGTPRYDPSRPAGRGQQAPLTPEYRAVLEASLADQANGGQGNWQSGARCLPPGMPGTMNGYNSMEIIVLPQVTYVLVEHDLPLHRRIFTDGRDWPKEIEPTYQGYSIGRWIDSTGSGRYDLLEVETRYFKGVRSYDNSGLPLHTDNQSIIRERIFLDRSDPKILHDEITIADHALTRPWSALKSYTRSPEKYPIWREENCPGITRLTKIGPEIYMKGADDKLMPTRADQPPPDLRYFKTAPR